MEAGAAVLNSFCIEREENNCLVESGPSTGTLSRARSFICSCGGYCSQLRKEKNKKKALAGHRKKRQLLVAYGSYDVAFHLYLRGFLLCGCGWVLILRSTGLIAKNVGMG